MSDLTDDAVTVYLNEHPEFLDRYVLAHVNQDRLNKWTSNRPQKTSNKQKKGDLLETHGGFHECKTSVTKWKSVLQTDNRKLLQELTKDINQMSNRSHILYELVCCIAAAVNADGFSLSLVDDSTQEIYQYNDNSQSKSQPKSTESIGRGGSLPAYVAYSKENIRLLDISQGDDRFPKGLLSGESAQSVISQPILYTNGDVMGVVELYRLPGCPYFTMEDEEVVTWQLLWTDITMQYCEMYHAMTRQRKLNDFLLTVTKSIFQDIVSMDTLIMKIMKFAQRLVTADRASLFLLDSQTNELYAKIFDVGINGRKTNREIR